MNVTPRHRTTFPVKVTKNVFRCQAASTKVMPTCPQLILDLISLIPNYHFNCQAALTEVMSMCPQLILDLMSGIPKLFSTVTKLSKSMSNCQQLHLVLNIQPKIHIKQLLHLFLVKIRICQPSGLNKKKVCCFLPYQHPYQHFVWHQN